MALSYTGTWVCVAAAVETSPAVAAMKAVGRASSPRHYLMGISGAVAHNASPEEKDYRNLPSRVGQLKEDNQAWKQAHAALSALPQYQDYRRLLRQKYELDQLLEPPRNAGRLGWRSEDWKQVGDGTKPVWRPNPSSGDWDRRVHAQLEPLSPEITERAPGQSLAQHLKRLEQAKTQTYRAAEAKALRLAKAERDRLRKSISALRKHLRDTSQWKADREARSRFSARRGKTEAKGATVHKDFTGYPLPSHRYEYVVGSGSWEHGLAARELADQLNAETFWTARAVHPRLDHVSVETSARYFADRADKIHIVLDEMQPEGFEVYAYDNDPTRMAFLHVKDNLDRLSDRVVFWKDGRRVEFDWEEHKRKVEALSKREKKNSRDVSPERLAQEAPQAQAHGRDSTQEGAD